MYIIATAEYYYKFHLFHILWRYWKNQNQQNVIPSSNIVLAAMTQIPSSRLMLEAEELAVMNIWKL